MRTLCTALLVWGAARPASAQEKVVGAGSVEVAGHTFVDVECRVAPATPASVMVETLSASCPPFGALATCSDRPGAIRLHVIREGSVSRLLGVEDATEGVDTSCVLEAIPTFKPDHDLHCEFTLLLGGATATDSLEWTDSSPPEEPAPEDACQREADALLDRANSIDLSEVPDLLTEPEVMAAVASGDCAETRVAWATIAHELYGMPLDSAHRAALAAVPGVADSPDWADVAADAWLLVIDGHLPRGPDGHRALTGKLRALDMERGGRALEALSRADRLDELEELGALYLPMQSDAARPPVIVADQLRAGFACAQTGFYLGIARVAGGRTEDAVRAWRTGVQCSAWFHEAGWEASQAPAEDLGLGQAAVQLGRSGQPAGVAAVYAVLGLEGHHDDLARDLTIGVLNALGRPDSDGMIGVDAPVVWELVEEADGEHAWLAAYLALGLFIHALENDGAQEIQQRLSDLGQRLETVDPHPIKGFWPTSWQWAFDSAVQRRSAHATLPPAELPADEFATRFLDQIERASAAFEPGLGLGMAGGRPSVSDLPNGPDLHARVTAARRRGLPPEDWVDDAVALDQAMHDDHFVALPSDRGFWELLSSEYGEDLAPDLRSGGPAERLGQETSQALTDLPLAADERLLRYIDWGGSLYVAVVRPGSVSLHSVGGTAAIAQLSAAWVDCHLDPVPLASEMLQAEGVTLGRMIHASKLHQQAFSNFQFTSRGGWGTTKVGDRDMATLSRELRCGIEQRFGLARVGEEALASALGGALLAPIVAELDDVRTLFFVFEGELRRLPPDLLRLPVKGGGGTLLGTRVQTAVLPTAASLSWLRRVGAPSTGTSIVVGDPLGDLPGSRAEMDEVADRLRRAGFPVETADEEGMWPQLIGEEERSHALIHVSSHVAEHPWHPGWASLTIRDSAGQVDHLDRYHLEELGPTRVVVLAGCRSSAGGLGRVRDGAVGDLGLVQGPLRDAARVVLASPIALEDEASRPLLRTFYAHLVDGKTVGESLREARRSLASSSSPDDALAPFTVYGDPEVTLRALPGQQ